ncbi:MAG: pyruvate:ferredoxin (flavodoxin) oxidoreductase [Fimbriimonas sp.]|nr:pyruvate:ferredoxin (flavodoxin) oxidoreductase [Fimbriimonas sp.]
MNETLEAPESTSVNVATIDGNEAAAYVAYRVNEVCSIYPITPSSTMAELADQWASEGKRNIWGEIPDVIEMQSEAGAAGTVHGALQAGSLTTTFTASQGLLLMIPNMYKIAGELTPCVIHVAARSLATQGLSIFGDHQDVMATRSTGFAMLASGSVQEAHDMALIAQAATLESRLPFIHFFDGFRTSHEVSKVEILADEHIREMIDEELVIAHRNRALNPDKPFIRGTAQNPDVYFQAREASSIFYVRCPDIVEKAMDQFASLTGRRYRLFDYYGSPTAERVIILMGSGGETVKETCDYLNANGENVGVVCVHLYRPFAADRLLAAIPPTVTRIAVLDRTKEPGAEGEPLYADIIGAFFEAAASPNPPFAKMPRILTGRYGLSSKEFNPGMVKAVYDELTKANPKNHFTVGINDDVTGLSIDYDRDFDIEAADVHRAIFYGLGADGTVGANKNTIKIIGEDPRFYAQGYFLYDSKKSGSQTVSHLRFGPRPIRSSYLVRRAQFVACHQFNFIERTDVLKLAADGGTFLLNSPYSVDDVWGQLPRVIQEQIVTKKLKFFVIDASKVARDVGMGNRTNTIMQTCFFAISGVLPPDQAIEKIKYSIEKTYGKKGVMVVRRNFDAVDQTIQNLFEVKVPSSVSSLVELKPPVSQEAPDFVQRVTARIIAGDGDDLAVSEMPIDGTFPSGTSRWEKRNIADFVPEWDPEACIQCGNCSFVCPHGVIRTRLFDREHLEAKPDGFLSAPIDAKGFPDTFYTLQVYTEDCTGCSLCVEACPVRSRTKPGKRAINMTPKLPATVEQGRSNNTYFETLPVNDRSYVDFGTVRGTQFLEPLFEFSGACAGCGETPYLKLLSQLFGDRMLVANATGCSSIYGANLPTTPWSVNHEGRGPAWSNSLFEDNAEFGLGMRVSADRHTATAQKLLIRLANQIGTDLVDDLITSPQRVESDIRKQRARVDALKQKLVKLDGPDVHMLAAVSDSLVRRSVWIIGGDGWAYDIGSGGLDHVLASGRNVNVLVMDTEVYSNTGGQASKSTPLAAVAKFANGGKQVNKKDLALQAMAYGNVYVARVAMGANPQQTLTAFREAEAYPGASLILAYSHCIAHGINMEKGLAQQNLAVHSGYWPLLRYNPELRNSDENPFVLDSARPHLKFKDFADNELRFRMLKQTNPNAVDRMMENAQTAIERRFKLYEELSQDR